MAREFSRSEHVVAWGLYAALLPLPFLVLGIFALLDPPRAAYALGLLLVYGFVIFLNGAYVFSALVSFAGLLLAMKYPVIGVVGTPFAAFLVCGVEEIVSWRRGRRGGDALLTGLCFPLAGLVGLMLALIGVYMNMSR